MDITKRPKAEAKPALAKPAKHLVTSTLRNLLTKDETEMHLLKTLTDTAAIKSTGPWRDYLKFYQANQSGDVTTMKPETRKMVEKMITDIKNEHFKNQAE